MWNIARKLRHQNTTSRHEIRRCASSTASNSSTLPRSPTRVLQQSAARVTRCCIHPAPNMAEDQPQVMASRDAPHPEGPPDAPGAPTGIHSKLLNVGMGLVQTHKPLSNICQHVCAFHCYAHDGSRQMRAHHFCSHLNEEMRQCIIYDNDSSKARLIGIEYIISQRLYEGLPEDEKPYWHSHKYEVLSGQLIAPGLPLSLQNEDAKKLVNTYGKTWHTWQVDRGDALPLGPAQLMLSFTADGQLDPELIKQRDKDMESDTEAARESRKDIQADPAVPHPAADKPWRTGRGWQTQLVDTEFKVPKFGAPSGGSS